MTRLALIEPRTLIGEAVRNALTQRRFPHASIDLLTCTEEEVGAVTEVAGGAALVQAFDAALVAAADVAIFCRPAVSESALADLEPTTRSVLIQPESVGADWTVAVAGISDPAVLAGNRLISPSPAVLLLAHLLAPLRDRAPIEVVAHVLQPASTHDQTGLDDLFQQTRSILSMSGSQAETVFGHQLAFNLLPWRGTDPDPAADLSALLGEGIRVYIHSSQAGVFHGLSAAISLKIAIDPGPEELRGVLLDQPLFEPAAEIDGLGPVSAASSDKILLGEIRPAPPDRYWIWCAVDNLSLSAHNALALAL